MKTVLAALCATGLALSAVPAAAETMKIEHSDLDLNTEKGQKILEMRISDAAREVCGIGKGSSGTRIQSRQSRECYAQAKQQATQQFAALMENNRLGG